MQDLLLSLFSLIRKSYKLLISFNCRLKLYRGVLQTFSYIKKNKIKIGILTNGSVKIQKKKILSLQLKNKVNKIVYAGDFKKQKPYKESFIKILKLLKVKSENTIFIGDNYKTDIVGAKKLNMFTIHYTKIKNDKRYTDLCVENFHDLQIILKTKLLKKKTI